MTTPAVKKPATHLVVSYVVCIAAATLLVAAIQALSHNALSVVEGGALTTVLAEAAVMALRATGQVDVPDAPAQLTAEDVSWAVTSAVSAALAPRPATAAEAAAPAPATPAAEAAPAGQ